MRLPAPRPMRESGRSENRRFFRFRMDLRHERLPQNYRRMRPLKSRRSQCPIMETAAVRARPSHAFSRTSQLMEIGSLRLFLSLPNTLEGPFSIQVKSKSAVLQNHMSRLYKSLDPTACLARKERRRQPSELLCACPTLEATRGLGDRAPLV